MKILILAAALMLTACGKKEKKNEWQLNPYEVNPVTGEITLIRAVVPLTKVYVNEQERQIYVLETQSKQESVRGFTCSGELRSGVTRFDLSADGRQLFLYGRLGQEIYERPAGGTSIIGSTWSRTQTNRNGRRSISQLTFLDQNSAQLIVECHSR